MINHKEIMMLIKKLELKHQCEDQIYGILVMHILLLQEILLLLKKTFTADDIEATNNTAASVTATNTANNNAFGEKKFVF